MTSIILETPETQSKIGYGATIASKITIEDFDSCINDKVFPESELISKYDLLLNEVEKKGELSTYEETLKNDKKSMTDKVTLWKMVTTPYGVTKEKWDNVIKAKFAKSSFKPETLEYTDKVRDTKSPSGFKEIQKIRLTNNLKDSTTVNLSSTIGFILENFEITDELRVEFETVLTSMESVKNESIELKTDKQNKLISDHTIKANSELFNVVSDFIKNRMESRLEELQNVIRKHEMSINFLSWKIKRIQIRKSENKIKELDLKAVDMNEKLMSKCKTDKKFVNLMNIAKKWSL